MIKKGGFSNHWFLSRYYVWRALESYISVHPAKSDSAKIFFQKALKYAYELGDDHLMAFVSWKFGELMHNYNERELAVLKRGGNFSKTPGATWSNG